VLDGANDGSSDGVSDGSPEGSLLGANDGSSDGVSDGSPEGSLLGANDGSCDGFSDGSSEGVIEGKSESPDDGPADASIESTAIRAGRVDARMVRPPMPQAMTKDATTQRWVMQSFVQFEQLRKYRRSERGGGREPSLVGPWVSESPPENSLNSSLCTTNC
jgi:hypothetical protein